VTAAACHTPLEPSRSSTRPLIPTTFPAPSCLTDPRPQELIARTLAEEAPTLRNQLHRSGARRVATLGQRAADAFASIFATERVLLRLDHTDGHRRSVLIANRRIDWLPLTHPGNRTPAWRTRHTHEQPPPARERRAPRGDRQRAHAPGHRTRVLPLPILVPIAVAAVFGNRLRRI
jgi:hypothetical protein